METSYDTHFRCVVAFAPAHRKWVSFENAYAVALRIHAQTGRVQAILRTADPVQPYRVATYGGEHVGTLLALVA
jgi:hypothetical protein